MVPMEDKLLSGDTSNTPQSTSMAYVSQTRHWSSKNSWRGTATVCVVLFESSAVEARRPVKRASLLSSSAEVTENAAHILLYRSHHSCGTRCGHCDHLLSVRKLGSGFKCDFILQTLFYNLLTFFPPFSFLRSFNLDLL